MSNDCVVNFDNHPISDEEYINMLRANMLNLIILAENMRALSEQGSRKFDLYDGFAEIGLDILFPGRDHK